MLYLVLLAKVGVVLMAGAAAVPGGPDRHSMRPTIGTSRSEIPIDAGHSAMTPLGAVWSRIIPWLRNRTATPQGYDPQDYDPQTEAAAAVPAFPEADPPR